MTFGEQAPHSTKTMVKDRQSNMGDIGRPGPNKDGASNPDGASALGNEVGAEADARRERQAALAQGDQLPPSDPGVTGSGAGLAGGLGFGQAMGAEKGYGQGPSFEQREKNQESKNDAVSGDGPIDAGAIARNSAGSANYHPTQDPDSIVSTANRRPAEILDTAGRSLGTESGAGAYGGGIVNQAETNNVSDP